MKRGFIAAAGFTLVELLIVIAILGVLASIALVAFRSSQARGRDAQRKSDLKQISSALELYYSDASKYPPGNASGQMQACPSTTQIPCVWGSGESNSNFTDTRTVYFKALPKDPVSSYSYFYRVDSTFQKFQIYTHLENSQDINCLPVPEGNAKCSKPANLPTGVTCGTGDCNFAVTSSNTTPTE